MLKKSTVAVITAMTTMLSVLSPATAAYAETPETIKTIPERTVSNETFTPYATAPVVYDSEYVQTTAATIPDRDVCCTTVTAPLNAQDILPISDTQEVTIKLIDNETDEHVKGALIHIVETESPTSNIIKRDFGVWNTSDSDSYTVTFDYTFENNTDMALITAVVEYIPEEYTFWANTECPVFDNVVDALYMKFNNYKPNTEMTIGLKKKQSSDNGTDNPDNPDNPDKITCWLCNKELDRDEAIGTPLGVWLCQECNDLQIIGSTMTTIPVYTTTTTTTSVMYCGEDILTQTTLPRPSTTTTTKQTTVTSGTRPPWLTGDTTTTVPENSGLFTAYCRVFDSSTNEIVENLELELVEENSGEIIAQWTSSNEPYIQDVIYSLTGDKNYVLRIIEMPDGFTIDETVPEASPNLQISEGIEMNGTLPFSIFIRNENTYQTTGGKLTYGDANCDDEVTIADAVLIMQSLSNPDKYKLSERGIMNADVYNRGDGITSADALSIQEVQAQIISLSDLPLSR